jgi:hypothetical protein
MVFILCFLFFLLQNQRTGGKNKFCLGQRAGTSVEVGEVLRKEDRKVNIVQKKMYIHVSKCKSATH